ncbi:MAG: NADH-ubiquinone oxidoreductase-F iron-sulfur binding region domain-containing protein [Nannocystaceae bacterium]
MRDRSPRIISHLNKLMHEHGWLRPDDLRLLAENLGEPLHRIEGLASFYPHYRRTPPPARTIEICRDLSCDMQGCAQLRTRANELAQAHQAATGERVEVVETSCLGRCERAPAALVDHHPVMGELGIRSALADNKSQETDNIPAHTYRCDPYTTSESRYATVRGLAARPHEDASTYVLTELKAAGLRGMGGAGFPTATKWGFVRKAKAPRKYVICNADESEPGTFKDREILATLPHLVWEGMLIAAHVVGATHCIVYIRHEYAIECEALAAEQARAEKVAEALGVTLEIFVSPGGYIMGEETALLEALEDRRGEPRNKPPYPGIEGLDGMPTVINNVETLAMATAICARGSAWWQKQGVHGCAGLKFMSVSGDVAMPGVYEVPMGTRVSKLIRLAGGMAGGGKLVAFLPGGASASFLPGDRADTPLDFDHMRQAGSTLGSGGFVAVGEGRDLLALGISLTRFFRNESCGKCVPCRVGSEKAVTLLEDMHQAGTNHHLPLLQDLESTMAQTSICGLGQVVLTPVLSLLKHFPELAPSPTKAD